VTAPSKSCNSLNAIPRKSESATYRSCGVVNKSRKKPRSRGFYLDLFCQHFQNTRVLSAF
jgi:hypothetical protein